MRSSMSYLKHDFSSLIVVDPKRAAREIVDKYRAHHCSQQEVAAAIGCGESTLCRWIAKLDRMGTGIKAKLEVVRKANGEALLHSKKKVKRAG